MKVSTMMVRLVKCDSEVDPWASSNAASRYLQKEMGPQKDSPGFFDRDFARPERTRKQDFKPCDLVSPETWP